MGSPSPLHIPVPALGLRLLLLAAGGLYAYNRCEDAHAGAEAQTVVADLQHITVYIGCIVFSSLFSASPVNKNFLLP